MMLRRALRKETRHLSALDDEYLEQAGHRPILELLLKSSEVAAPVVQVEDDARSLFFAHLLLYARPDISHRRLLGRRIIVEVLAFDLVVRLFPVRLERWLLLHLVACLGQRVRGLVLARASANCLGTVVWTKRRAGSPRLRRGIWLTGRL